MKSLFWFPKKDQKFYTFRWFFFLSFYGGLSGLFLIVALLIYFAGQVPDYRQLADYKPELITKVYDRNGDLLAEYAKQRRIYLPIEDIPEDVRNTFLAAEDSEFYSHGGFDIIGILRAVYVNTFTSGKQGASTITQQVAKTFLLTRERTYTRKIKELILAYRIEKAFSKDKILELYLNRIYLGNGAYGVAAAALAYYNKTLKELSTGQRAMLAGLPKAPSYYSPVRNPQQARFRRDVILGRMAAEKFITEEERASAVEKDLELNPKALEKGNKAPHFSEHVRRFLEKQYGVKALYEGGLSVFTTLDAQLQTYAENAMYKGLRDYDRRHGYRGPVGKLPLRVSWQKYLEDEKDRFKRYKDIGQIAAVLSIDTEKKEAEIGLLGNKKGLITLSRLKWARDYIDADNRGSKIKEIADVLEPRDLILVKPVSETIDYHAEKEASFNEEKALTYYSLEQAPQVEGALVALDVKTGAIMAMVGGLGEGNGFNRAVQAKRQVGSAIKPFVYAMALENGYTPASIILDAPVVMRQEETNEAWKPQNYSEKVYGPSTLRRGLEKSRNLMTIRLARDLGVTKFTKYAKNFGLDIDRSHGLSAALGSTSLSLFELTSAYSVFPNGGIYVPPYFIDSIQDNTGSLLQTHIPECVTCNEAPMNAVYAPPSFDAPGYRVMPKTTAYLTTYLLQGVVQRGTAWRAKRIPQATGAKTGTTNDFIDAWLMGFSPNLAIGVWVGFDKPKTMGYAESGSKAAGPIWVDFAQNALKGKNNPFKVPEGITFVQIDAEKGTLPTAETKNRFLEAFEIGSEPSLVTNNRVHKAETAADKEDITVDFQGLY